MEKYYALVSLAKDKGVLSLGLCGQLHAHTFSEAEIAAGEYRDFLNDYKRLDELKGDFHIVQAHSYEQVVGLPEFRWIKDNELSF